MKKITQLFIYLICVGTLSAQIPSGYYNGTEGIEGYTLKSKLSKIITNGHKDNGYKHLYTGYYATDVDVYYENDGTVLDMYSENPNGTDPYTFSFGDNCGSYSSEGDCYNREHLMPQSVFHKQSPMRNDIHFVVPSDGKVNGKRGHYPFGEVKNAIFTSKNGSKLGSCKFASHIEKCFEPIDEFKGDIARMLFYFVTRYEDKLSSFEVSNGMLNGSKNQGFSDWELEELMRWHLQDPVSQRELDRNNAAYDYQGNRNPFIDHPEWVVSIWGGPNVDPADDVIFSEDFNECSAVKFKTVSELSDQNWECTTKYGHDNSGAYQMNAYSGGASIVSKDWLITSTAIDLDNYKDKKLSVYAKSKYGNTPLKILYSNNYNGNGMPQNFTWKEVPNATLPTPVGSEVETNVNADINALTGKVYFAFLYENPADVEASRWTVDNFVVKGISTLSTDEVEAEVVDFQVYPNPVTNREVFVKGQDLNKIKSVTIYNIEGKVVKTVVNPFIHGNRLDISGLAKGVYFIQTPHRTVKLMVK